MCSVFLPLLLDVWGLTGGLWHMDSSFLFLSVTPLCEWEGAWGGEGGGRTGGELDMCLLFLVVVSVRLCMRFSVCAPMYVYLRRFLSCA